jgi:hypothetical protein
VVQHQAMMHSRTPFPNPARSGVDKGIPSERLTLPELQTP